MLPTRILLIDDHALFRSGLRMVLKTGADALEIFEAASLEEAMRLTIEAPAILLLDIQLQGLNGLQGMTLIKRKWPHAAIIVLSSDNAPETVRLARERGAVSYVSKADTADAILGIVSQVLHGQLAKSEKPVHAPPNPLHPPVPRLTPRQYEVLGLLCQGLSNKMIGRRMDLSENTVRGHVQAVLAVLHVSSRSEAAFAARRSGLVG